MGETVEKLIIETQAMALYLGNIRHLQAWISKQTIKEINLAAAIPDGPEAVLKVIDEASCLRPNMKLITATCASYDKLIHDCAKAIENQSAK